MRVQLRRALLSMKNESLLVRENEVEKFDKTSVIAITDPTPEQLPPLDEYPAAPTWSDDQTVESRAAALDDWAARKAAWEEAQAALPPYKIVTVWVPVYHVLAATIDGYPVKVMHTLRGPMIGLVTSETSNSVTLYSPAYIDPNLQSGRVHYLPVAFAGYKLNVHKPCFGDSVPEQAVCLGYPAFIKHNQKGDYVMRSKGAYHHIDADVPVDAPAISADVGIRSQLEGVLVTSDSKQARTIAAARAMNQAVNKSPVTKTTPDGV